MAREIGRMEQRYQYHWGKDKPQSLLHEVIIMKPESDGGVSSYENQLCLSTSKRSEAPEEREIVESGLTVDVAPLQDWYTVVREEDHPMVNLSGAGGDDS